MKRVNAVGGELVVNDYRKNRLLMPEEVGVVFATQKKGPLIAAVNCGGRIVP